MSIESFFFIRLLDWIKRIKKIKNKKRAFSFLTFLNSTYKNYFFVTDLSTAGLPAKLKHITQRRKRKQPWFLQSAASEEGSNSMPNRVIYTLSCGTNVVLWLVRDWRNSMCKANPAEHNPSCEYWAIEGVSPLSQKPEHHIMRTKRVALLGSEVSSGRYMSAKVKYRVGRPIANK